MNNILLTQICPDGSSFKFKEIVPNYSYNAKNQFLTLDKNGSIYWNNVDPSVAFLVNNKFQDTDIYYEKGRIGLNRFPLFNYKVDVAIPKNSLMTAFHIGDGSFGFSMGNGTKQGFIPEIIGIGSNENDAGLYFVAIAGNDISSNIPLIVLDGRDTYNDKLSNRPILGITSGDYENYTLLLDASNNLNIKGKTITTDIIIENKSLIDTINKLKKDIELLKNKIGI
jgi:hypothetical protein